MTPFKEYLNALTIFFSFAFGLQFAFKNKGVLCLKIIAIQLILISFLLVAFIFLEPSLLLRYPHIFRVVSPLIYTLTPTAFLFHYYFLRPEKRFNYLFLLLYLPFLIQVAENFNFYLLPVELKLEEIRRYLASQDYFYHSSKYVWFPPMLHAYFKIFQYIIFGSLMAFDLYLYVHGKLTIKPKKGSLVKFWLFGNLLFRFCTISFLIYEYILHFEPKISTSGLGVSLVLEVIFINLFLMFNPSLLDGHYFQEYLLGNFNKSIGDSRNKDALTKEVFHTHLDEQKKIIQKIEDYFARSNDYLELDFSVEKLAEKINVPQRFISFSLKQVLEMTSKDYINKKRLEYLIDIYPSDVKYQKYSFDYLAEIIGFRSRQSLYSAIAKFYKCTPKELFDRLV